MSWASWMPCSTSCGIGKTTRHRNCITTSGSFPVFEDGQCNQGVVCPSWSNWSNWDECSASCDGGTKSRSRECQNGLPIDCPGSPIDEQKCSRDSCTTGFVYWDGYVSTGAISNNVLDSVMATLPGKNAIDKCQKHCLSIPGCIAFEAEQYVAWNGMLNEACYYTTSSIDDALDSFGYTKLEYPYMKYAIKTPDGPIVAMLKEFYENLEIRPANEPDGAIIDGALIQGVVNVDGYCDEVDTGFGFGKVNYRTFDKIEFVPLDKKNIIKESSTSGSDCAVKCFQKAGCTAFFTVDNDCTYIIDAASKRVDNNAVTDAGMLSPGVCPLTAFTTTFKRKGTAYSPSNGVVDIGLRMKLKFLLIKLLKKTQVMSILHSAPGLSKLQAILL